MVQLLRRIYVAATQKLLTMTQTSDAATEDTTMSDAYSMYRKGSDDSALSATTKTSIKFAFKLQKTESTDISPKHCDILVAITKSDLCSVILDKDGNQLNISPNSKIDHKFSYEKFP